MGIQKLNNKNDAGDYLIPYFSWAGSNFPYNSNAENITISSNTTWNDVVGYKKVGILTIAAGVTLTIAKSPFFIFADEINFGNGLSTINISGSASVGGTAKGASVANGSGNICSGGYGGGFLIIVANKITGANGRIWANGENATISGYNSSLLTGGGQGALSAKAQAAYEVWDGKGTSGNRVLWPIAHLLAGKDPAETDSWSGGGGGSGSFNSINPTAIGGGSGIGSGGGYYSYSGSESFFQGRPAPVTFTPAQLIQLALMGCLGGGGGGALGNTSSNNSLAAGGGGGAIAIFTKLLSATPILQANGGTGNRNGTTDSRLNGGAGQTIIVQV